MFSRSGSLLVSVEVYLLCLTCASSMLFSFFTNAPFLLIDKIGISPKQFSILFAINAFGLILGGIITTCLTKKINIDNILALGGIIAFIGGLSMLLFGIILPLSIFSILVPMLLCSIGIAIIIPVSFAGSINYFPNNAGSASAMGNFLRYSGAFLVITVLSYFKGEDQLFLGIAMTLCSLTVLISCIFQKLIYFIRDSNSEAEQLSLT